MAISLIIGAAFLAFAVVPRLFLAQVRGRTESMRMGAAPGGVPMPAGEGLQQMVIDGGEISAHIIRAVLEDEDIMVKVDSTSAGLGGFAASYSILYRTEDEPRVLEAVAIEQASSPPELSAEDGS